MNSGPSWPLVRLTTAAVEGAGAGGQNLTPSMFPSLTDAIVERAGAAAGVSETCSELGGALGIAILGSIGTAIYRAAMTAAVPAGIPTPLAEAARGTLGGALAAVRQLPDVGPAMLDTACHAFTSGLRVTGAISALIMIAMAVLVVRSLRHVRPTAI